MSQCQLCLAYIKEIKEMKESLKVQSILLNEQEKNHKEESNGLQRHIDALKGLLTSKGILLNEGEEKEIYFNQDFYDEDYENNKWEYDYARDDMNFDAERERRMK